MLSSSKMPKVFFCSNCLLQHARPVGKKCQQMQGESFSGDVDVPAPPSPTYLSPSVSDKILLQLQQLGAKMEQMDRRVQRTEAALEEGSTQASSSVSPAASSSNNPVGGSAMDDATVQSVIPSIDYLRTSESLQSEVERRLAELKNINEFATRGRVKSQRGDPGDISVKRVMDWPQNFILTGNQKTRPTYDDLNITQWVSGFVRCIQEEKSKAIKSCMLDYLGNIMEDASDFSWESAKAAHAILLINMEADRLNWAETDKIDRIHRAHAQRHITGTQNSATCPVNRKVKNTGTKNGIICRYFQEGTCKFTSHHRTAGQYYRHACDNCDCLQKVVYNC